MAKKIYIENIQVDYNNTISLKDGDYIIGRSTHADIPIPEDEELSRVHLKIKLSKNKIEVEDLSSKNGSFMDDKSLMAAKSYVWDAGSVLRLGLHTLLRQNEEVTNKGKKFGII